MSNDYRYVEGNSIYREGCPSVEVFGGRVFQAERTAYARAPWQGK